MMNLYNSGSQTTAVRFVMILSLFTAVGACIGGFVLFRSYGLSPGDGGVLAPLATRLTWGLVLAGLGLAFALGMWLYGRNYVRAIHFDPYAQVLHFRTLGMFGDGHEAVTLNRVRGSTFRSGRLDNPVGVSVNAPWYKVSIDGRGSSYILDAQGQFYDPPLLARLIRA